MPSLMMLLRLVGLLLAAAAIVLSLVDLDIAAARSGTGVSARPLPAVEVLSHAVPQITHPVRASTLGS